MIGDVCCICESNNNVCRIGRNGKPYCGKHRSQMERHGKILERTKFDENEFTIHDTFAEICLYDIKQNIIAKTIIDLDDVERCRNHRWYLKQSGGGKTYCQERENRLQLSHFISGFVKEKGWDVDHIDGDSLNNRKSNLRIVTHQHNMMNQRKLPSNNTSGVIGVGWNKENKCWDAQIKHNKILHHLGSFKNKDDAIKARHDAELFYFGEHKTINFE